MVSIWTRRGRIYTPTCWFISCNWKGTRKFRQNHPAKTSFRQDRLPRNYGTTWTPVLRRSSVSSTSSTYTGGATSATGKGLVGTESHLDRPVGGRVGVGVSTSNRYSLLACDHGDHHGSYLDTTGGAIGAPSNALTSQTMKVSQFEKSITENQKESDKNVEPNKNVKKGNDRNYGPMPKTSPTQTIVRGQGCVASGDSIPDSRPMAQQLHTTGPVGLGKCCRFFCCGVDKKWRAAQARNWMAETNRRRGDAENCCRYLSC